MYQMFHMPLENCISIQLDEDDGKWRGLMDDDDGTWRGIKVENIEVENIEVVIYNSHGFSFRTLFTMK